MAYLQVANLMTGQVSNLAACIGNCAHNDCPSIGIRDLILIGAEFGGLSSGSGWITRV